MAVSQEDAGTVLREGLQNVDLKKPELNTRSVRSLGLYFESRFGREALENILAQTGLDRGYLEHEHNWVSMAYRDRLIKAMTEHSKDRRFAYKAGCFTATREAIGIAYNVLASFTRPRFLYKKLIELTPHFNKIGQFTILELTDTSLTCIYQPISDEYWDEGPGAEFRLGQLVAFPRLCGLPDAEYEHAIIEVGGRPAYHYIFRWNNPPRSFAPLYGAMVGLLVGLVDIWRIPGLSERMMVMGFTAIGLLIGIIYTDKRRITQLTTSIIHQQDGLSRSDEALQQRYNELYAQNIEIVKLNGELHEKVEDLERATQEIQALNADLQAFNATLQQRVDEQTRKLKDRNHMLEVMNAKLRELDQVKTQFFARINHELRTPLTLILPPIESMLTDTTHLLPKSHRQLLETMRQNAYRLLKLINSLLDLARSEEGKMRLRYEPVDLNHLISAVAEEVRPSTVRHRLELRTTFEPGLPSVSVDTEKIESVVLNLLSNAVKFTPAGGVIEVSTSATDTQIIIQVRDTGHGIEKNRLPRIFDRFAEGGTEVERGYGGTGIGLSLVKQFVEFHNGQVEVHSEVEKGTVFTIWLPQGEGTVRQEFSERRRAAGTAPINRRRDDSLIKISDYITNAHEINMSEFRDLEKERMLESGPRIEGWPTVLIVDDDVDMRCLLTALLQKDYNILTAANRLEGEAMARANLPDLILCDVHMAEKDAGYSFCRDLKGDPKTGEIPIILMSARPESGEGIAMGADDYIAKPFNLRELWARIKAHIARRELVMKLWQKNRELEEKNALIEKMAKTDALTGLYNRRYLEDFSRRAFERARSGGTKLSCIMIDIDHFKRFNTQYGHAGGDAVLREIGKLLNSWVDEPAVAARYGGEEFAVLLPERDLDQAEQLAETLMEAVRSQTFDAVHRFHITLSMGVASWPDSPADGHEMLFQVADEALYRAKERRDCIQVERSRQRAATIPAPSEDADDTPDEVAAGAR